MKHLLILNDPPYGTERSYNALRLARSLLLGAVTRRNGEVAVCGTCMDARGVTDAELIAGAQRGTMDQLTEWTAWADKVLVF